MIWTNEIISAELDKCEQSADVAALMRAMRDEYESELAVQYERIERLNTESEMIKDALSEKGQAQQEAMLRFQKQRIVELEAQLAAAAVEVSAIRDQVILSHEEEQRRFVELEKQHGVLDRVITTNNALYLHEYNRATTIQSARIAELEAQLAAALATIEQAATPDEWQDKPLMYVAVENPESGDWGVEDSLGGILYDAEDMIMNQAQAEALAMAHNDGVDDFNAALHWFQARGVDWAKL
jgi:hypothetical protein